MTTIYAKEESICDLVSSQFDLYYMNLDQLTEKQLLEPRWKRTSICEHTPIALLIGMLGISKKPAWFWLRCHVGMSFPGRKMIWKLFPWFFEIYFLTSWQTSQIFAVITIHIWKEKRYLVRNQRSFKLTAAEVIFFELSAVYNCRWISRGRNYLLILSSIFTEVIISNPMERRV